MACERSVYGPGYWRGMMLVVVVMVLALGIDTNDRVAMAAKPDCNQFQLLTCIGSVGGPPKDDCCEAIRKVLDPRCVCTKSVKANVQVLLPIAKDCQVHLDVSHCH